MTLLQNFAFGEQLVRVVTREDEPWFVAADIARILMFRDAAAAIRSVPDEEKGTQKVCTLGGEQDVIIISEPGLYRLIFRSSKPEAEKFRRWVFHDVLPAIRKTGSYNRAELSPGPDLFEIDLQHAPLSAKVDMLRFVSRHYGRQAALRYFPKLGLPDIDGVFANARVIAGGRECLAHILSFVGSDGQTVGDLIRQARQDLLTPHRGLREIGIRLATIGDAGIYLATNWRMTGNLFAGTEWAGGLHVAALRGLDGVISHKKLKFVGNDVSMTIFIPAGLLMNPF